MTAAAPLPGGGYIVLNTTLTPELIDEGHVNDFVRLVQLERKRQGLSPTARIELVVNAPLGLARAFSAHAETIKTRCMVTSFREGSLEGLPWHRIADGLFARFEVRESSA